MDKLIKKIKGMEEATKRESQDLPPAWKRIKDKHRRTLTRIRKALEKNGDQPPTAGNH